MKFQTKYFLFLTGDYSKEKFPIWREWRRSFKGTLTAIGSYPFTYRYRQTVYNEIRVRKVSKYLKKSKMNKIHDFDKNFPLSVVSTPFRKIREQIPKVFSHSTKCKNFVPGIKHFFYQGNSDYLTARDF